MVICVVIIAVTNPPPTQQWMQQSAEALHSLWNNWSVEQVTQKTTNRAPVVTTPVDVDGYHN